MTLIHIIWTVGLLIVFIAIVTWAYSARRKEDFIEAANLPLEDEVYATVGHDTVVNAREQHHD